MKPGDLVYVPYERMNGIIVQFSHVNPHTDAAIFIVMLEDGSIGRQDERDIWRGGHFHEDR